MPRLPARLVAGWIGRTWLGRVELLLGAALLVAFALSGHAAAVPARELSYGVSVDLLHLLGNAAWVGGLLYVTLALIPALTALNTWQRGRVLALGLLAFDGLAIVGAGVLAATGSLNATIRLTSLLQLVTTAYGRVLVVKIEFFLLMAVAGNQHGFVWRPRLARTLAESAPAAAQGELGAPAVTGGVGREAGEAGGAERKEAEEVGYSTQQAADRMEDWLRREALLGVGILLCVALLGAFAGTVVPAPR